MELAEYVVVIALSCACFLFHTELIVGCVALPNAVSAVIKADSETQHRLPTASVAHTGPSTNLHGKYGYSTGSKLVSASDSIHMDKGEALPPSGRIQGSPRVDAGQTSYMQPAASRANLDLTSRVHGSENENDSQGSVEETDMQDLPSHAHSMDSIPHLGENTGTLEKPLGEILDQASNQLPLPSIPPEGSRHPPSFLLSHGTAVINPKGPAPRNASDTRLYKRATQDANTRNSGRNSEQEEDASRQRHRGHRSRGEGKENPSGGSPSMDYDAHKVTRASQIHDKGRPVNMYREHRGRHLLAMVSESRSNGAPHTFSPEAIFKEANNSDGLERCALVNSDNTVLLLENSLPGDYAQRFQDYVLHFFQNQTKAAIRTANVLNNLFRAYDSRPTSFYNDAFYYSMARMLVESDPLVYGATIAFDRGQYSPQESAEDDGPSSDTLVGFAPSAQRNKTQNGSIEILNIAQITKGRYANGTRGYEWFWKRRAENYSFLWPHREKCMEEGFTETVESYMNSATVQSSADTGLWTEPYFDCTRGRSWVITYSVPFFGCNREKQLHFK